LSAGVADVCETTGQAVVNCLSGKSLGGGGPHGLFMKTWAAGLAYSNGYGYSQSTGRVSYYAERCPDVSETMKFVVSQVQNPPDDPSLVDYAVAQVFQASRAPSKYEARGEAMAADLADGFTPERVASFREKVLSVRDREHLFGTLKEHMPQAYGPVLIGYGPTLASSKNANFFLIGPKQQFKSLEDFVDLSETDHSLSALPEGLLAGRGVGTNLTAGLAREVIAMGGGRFRPPPFLLSHNAMFGMTL
jgi:hypothetical protein